MFFKKKRKIEQLKRLCNQYEYELYQFKYWKEIKEEHEINNARSERYSLPSPEILDNGNHIILDELDLFNGIGIMVFKLKKPVERWMLDLRSSLQYKHEYAKCIARIELGMTIDNFTKIEKLGVDPAYRKKGVATYLLKRTISWGKEKGISGLYLTACASSISYENSLTQDELVQFYKNLGFQQRYDECSDYLVYYYNEKRDFRWI
ncbi:GNAT family N-acetyltransferase [Enterococcus faecalis]|uniref:GNAT family N-acetyltransferase n=1 Tax=Enterococcus faecalis TaxID=1351 RepID=UPI0025B10F6B|nr:GNAT family N-acetyltransferase [Enterococcus faecalis]MDN3185405.1 GNAT family N-acetyltransferase [Enterococcus faecalis]